MATEKRLIDANGCPCIKCDRLGNCRPGLCKPFAEWWLASLDAVEVVHGRWSDVSLSFTHPKEKCSVCGGIVYAHGFNYCPNCGAKMDGDGNG